LKRRTAVRIYTPNPAPKSSVKLIHSNILARLVPVALTENSLAITALSTLKTTVSIQIDTAPHVFSVAHLVMLFASAPSIAGREFPKILCWDDVDHAPLIQLECLPDKNPSEFLAAMLRHWNLQTAEIRLGATIPELGEHFHGDQILLTIFN
jgi:hypothetical protein